MLTCRYFTITLLLLLPLATLGQLGNDFETFYKAAKKFTVKPLAKKPAWATPKERALFRVGWLSDMHIATAETQRLSTAACQSLRDRLHPDLTFITGDNCGWPAPFFPRRKGVDLDHNRQLWLKDFLNKELGLRYLLLPGDNWPGAFAEVFGATQRSFDFGGFHFIFLATDAITPAQEGCQMFFPETLEWLADDLRQHRQKPTLLVMHEPVYPPGMLDAHKIHALINQNQQVIAVLAGHFHLDLEFVHGHWTQLIAPALGNTPHPAFKFLAFYRDQIVIETWEAAANSRFRQHPLKWQQIVIPESLRQNLHPVNPGRTPTLDHYQERPPHDVVIDPALATRMQEYLGQCMAFVIDYALSTILP